jgi:UDP-N-acetyl-D-glucosamine dehydrogenase
LRVVEGLPAGIDVTVVDPHVDSESVARQVARSPEEVDIEGADAVVLLVNHDAFDLSEIGERADCVFDTRNAMPSGTGADVIKLGEMVDTVDTDAVLPTQ